MITQKRMQPTQKGSTVDRGFEVFASVYVNPLDGKNRVLQGGAPPVINGSQNPHKNYRYITYKPE